MTAPLFLVEPGTLDGLAVGDSVRVTGAEGHHAVSVMRLARGEPVLVSDGRGRRVAATVQDLERSLLVVAIVADDSPPPDPRSLTLVQALAKGDRDELAVELATEYGVDTVVPWQAARSIARWRPERAERGRRSWESTAIAATKQSRRATVPVVTELARTAEVTDRVRAAALAVILHESADTPLATLNLPDGGEIVLVVGPEGGLTDDELRTFTDAGGYAVRLGPEVLRTSSAGAGAIAVLNARGRWR